MTHKEIGELVKRIREEAAMREDEEANLRERIKELEWQVKNWERKEVERATCCEINAQENKRLRAALEEVNRLISDPWIHVEDRGGDNLGTYQWNGKTKRRCKACNTKRTAERRKLRREAK
jgi:hypothetical protein